MAKVAAPKDLRTSARIPHSSPIEISWIENSETKVAHGVVIEISVGGMRIEVPECAPANRLVTFRIEAIDLSGVARVRHVTPHGDKFILGLELTPETRNAIGVSFS